MPVELVPRGAVGCQMADNCYQFQLSLGAIYHHLPRLSKSSLLLTSETEGGTETLLPSHNLSLSPQNMASPRIHSHFRTCLHLRTRPFLPQNASPPQKAPPSQNVPYFRTWSSTFTPISPGVVPHELPAVTPFLLQVTAVLSPDLKHDFLSFSFFLLPRH